MKTVLFVFLTLFIYPSICECQVNPQKKDLNVVLIAGPNDHCDHDSSCHKYIQDLLVIKDCLSQQTSVGVRMLVAERPKIGSLDDVDVVVVHSAGDDTVAEWNALFPRVNQKEQYQNSEYAAFLKYFDERMNEGMGLVVLHYATAVNHKESISRYKKWIGGYFNEETSEVDGDYSSDGSTAIEAVEFAKPNHEILNGISPWESESEFYYKLDIEKNATPILTSNLPIDKPRKETIAWAFERPDGGRGFGFTGCHNHNNMYLEDFRKFVLNAIIWTGGSTVPQKGISSKLSKRYF